MIPPWIRDLDGADPYELLGVSRTVETAAVSAAYLKLIKVVHPDLPTGDETRAKQIGLARDILVDPVKRADYNRYADTGSAAEPAAASVWDDADIADGVLESPVWTVHEPDGSYEEDDRGMLPRKVYGLGLGSIFASALCMPVGLVIAIVALGDPRRHPNDRLCAWAGIGVGLLQLLLCCLFSDSVLTVIDPSLDY